MDKTIPSVDEAVSVVKDGDTVMVGGFGGAGFPFALREALIRQRRKELTVVCNNGDFGGLAYDNGLVKLICSFPVGPTAKAVLDQIEAGNVELELTPQGTLAERIRAGGAGLGGVLTPTGVDTEYGERFDEIEHGGRRYLLAPALRANVALMHARVADTYGNLVFRYAARNFCPLMAMAADVTIAEVEEIVQPGEIDPNHVHVPSAFVDGVVLVKGDDARGA